MPQVHNKSLSLSMDSSAFNKNSRFMAALNFTEQSMHRVTVLNSLDQRLFKVKLKYFERHSKINDRKIQRVKNRLQENLSKRLAYKYVLKKHSIANAKDYKKALDKNYSYGALHHEVNQMVDYIKPEHVRERRARALLDRNRQRYTSLIQENRAALDVLCPPQKRWEAVDFSKFGKTEDEEEDKTPSPELPPIEKRNKNLLAGLRRRVITLDDSKPSSPIKTPMKTPTLSKPPSSNSLMGGKRQGITMSMMKKQKSFMDAKERTGTLDRIDTSASRLSKNIAATDKPLGAGTSVDVNNNELQVPGQTHTKDTNELNITRRTSIEKSQSPILPPISPKQQGFHPNDIKISPSVSPTKPVKLPVLKMNNSRKEINVH